MSEMRTNMNSKSMDFRAVEVRNAHKQRTPNRSILVLWRSEMRTTCTPNRWILGLWRSNVRTNMHSKSMDSRVVAVRHAHKRRAPSRWILVLWRSEMRTACTPNRWILGLWRSNMRTTMHSTSMDTRVVEVQSTHKNALQIDGFWGCGGPNWAFFWSPNIENTGGMPAKAWTQAEFRQVPPESLII